MKRFFSLEYLALFIPAVLICVAAVWFTLRYVQAGAADIVCDLGRKCGQPVLRSGDALQGAS